MNFFVYINLRILNWILGILHTEEQSEKDREKEQKKNEFLLEISY